MSELSYNLDVPTTNKSGAKARPKAQRVVGLRHIAEELNISISLVSKVLSGRLGTSGANAQMIRAIHTKAEELDYKKNRLAESLRTGKQNVIGVLVHRHGTSGSAIVDDMMRGIADEAAARGQRLQLQFYETMETFRSFSAGLHRNSVDGVILGGLSHRELLDDLKTMHANGLPIVTVHDDELADPFPNIGMDQREVTRQATLHLIDRGCKQLSHFGISDYATNLCGKRFSGFRAALAERGLPFLEELIVNTEDFGYDAAVVGARELLARNVPFDGIVGLSDEHACAAVNVLISAGRRVPEDVKVIGIDDAPICKCAIVPISSVSQEFRVRGQMAVNSLMKLLDGSSCTSTNVQPVVCARSSTKS